MQPTWLHNYDVNAIVEKDDYSSNCTLMPHMQVPLTEHTPDNMEEIINHLNGDTSKATLMK